MKDFIKTFWNGFQVVSMSIGAIMCFVLQIPLYKFLVESNGFWAVLVFVGMVWLLVGGILIIWMLGCLDEAYNKEVKKYE